MGLLGKALGATGWGSLAAVGGWVALTHKSTIKPLEAGDYIYKHALYAQYNPNNAPVTQDICVRPVPLSKIKPELLEGASNGKLAEAFCAGVWGGLGYAYQRRYLEKKYRGPETADQLWERRELQESKYEVGTKITDHFQVVAKTPSSIIVRCGDSPGKVDVRESDGLFEMMVDVNNDEGVAVFVLKSVFFNGLNGHKGTATPMSHTIQRLHGLYAKLLIETAIRNVTK